MIECWGLSFSLHNTDKAVVAEAGAVVEPAGVAEGLQDWVLSILGPIDVH